jgi:hypothetical protein
MAKSKNKSANTQSDELVPESSERAVLSSVEEMILRMRFGLGKDLATDSLDRDVSEDLRKKLQFLELKAFEQSGRINELLSDIKKKGTRRKP